MNPNLRFVGTYFNAAALGGLGEHRARFVCVKHGEEDAAKDLVRAFRNAAARNNLRLRGQVVTMNAQQVADRIEQIMTMPAHTATVDELHRGLKALDKRSGTQAPGSKS